MNHELKDISLNILTGREANKKLLDGIEAVSNLLIFPTYDHTKKKYDFKIEDLSIYAYLSNDRFDYILIHPPEEHTIDRVVTNFHVDSAVASPNWFKFKYADTSYHVFYKKEHMDTYIDKWCGLKNCKFNGSYIEYTTPNDD